MPTVMINGKKHTPSSGTLKKMKARAAAEAAAKKAMPKAKAKATTPKVSTKAPIPATMSDSLRNKRAANAASAPKWSSGSGPTTPAKKDATPYINPKMKAPIPAKMPEGIKY